ncbi:saccharopine dehydrogenase NADP-binding domain-containing protein [Massilia sp. S19_KUP03_FR1]|uniref:saccharopine dehydrogenase NADP-binding domain-containing protein n=1 Tax=Massilia sp. S19_KUP03_FR1 TaxID=3025503 RepID=UPI002FCDC2E5
MKIVLIGYGSIGQALTPMLLRHFPQLESIRAFAADDRGLAVAQQYGVLFALHALTADNFRRVLAASLAPGDLLINVSVNVASLALIAWCRKNLVLYLDTCLEPWAGGYEYAQITNYALREQAMRLRGKGPVTALVANGANPGLITHFVKMGLEELALIKGVKFCGNHAQLALDLGVSTVQIAECDTQDDQRPHPRNTFVNTWSVDGFIAELCHQPVEMGWGSHEGPRNDVRGFDRSCSVTMPGRTGLDTRVRSWVPSVGEQAAHLVTHHEAHSIADMLTVREHGLVRYRPTVYYAYRPCEQAREMIDRLRRKVACVRAVEKTVMQHPVTGQDELGALLIHNTGAYWYGSTLTAQQAKALAPCNNATSMQVVATIVASIKWMLLHPHEGVIEPEDVDHNFVLHDALPCLGHVGGVETGWRPADVDRPQLQDYLIHST